MNQYQEGLIDFIVLILGLNDQKVHASNDYILKLSTVETDQEIEVIDILLNIDYN